MELDEAISGARKARAKAFRDAADMLVQALAEWTEEGKQTVPQFGHALHTKLEARAKGE